LLLEVRELFVGLELLQRLGRQHGETPCQGHVVLGEMRPVRMRADDDGVVVCRSDRQVEGRAGCSQHLFRLFVPFFNEICVENGDRLAREDPSQHGRRPPDPVGEDGIGGRERNEGPVVVLKEDKGRIEIKGFLHGIEELSEQGVRILAGDKDTESVEERLGHLPVERFLLPGFLEIKQGLPQFFRCAHMLPRSAVPQEEGGDHQVAMAVLSADETPLLSQGE